MKHFLVKIDGYTVQEVMDEYKVVNVGFVNVIKRLQLMLENGDFSNDHIEYLNSQEFYFHKREINWRDTQHFINADIYRNILHSTLSDTIYHTKIIFGKDIENWQESYDSIRTTMFRFWGNHYRYLVWCIDKLYNNLKELTGEYVKSSQMSEFEKCFNFETILYEVQLIEDLHEKKAFIKKTIADCKEFCLKKQAYHISDKEETPFINKCQKAIDIVNLQLDDEQAIKTVIAKKTAPIRSLPSIFIASKRKTDIIKILSALYDARMFAEADGKPLTYKQKLMEAFGEFLGDDFTAYSTSLSQAKIRDRKTFMKPFTEIEKARERYLEE